MVWSPVFICVTLLFITSTLGDSNWNYIVMFDAGSTSTKAFVYKWPTDEEGIPKLQAFTDVVQNASLKITPGISTLTPSQVANYLAPIVTWAKSVVPPSQISKTGIFLKATAGMRLLPESQQEAILVAVRSVLSNSSFLFSSDNAKVISGTEEGIFGWIAVNFLKNNFFNHTATMIGALDLGGASTQITFEPDVTYIPSNMVPFQINNLQYQLYVYSYLGYGNDQFRILKDTYITNTTSSVVNDPCSNVGYNYNYTNSDNRTVTVKGTGNVTECRAILQILLYKQANTSINGNYQPTITNEPFLAFSGYYTAKSYYPPIANQDIIKVEDYFTAAANYCSTAYSQVSNIPYSSTTCFLIVSAYVLLHDAYGIADQTPIEVPASINNVAVNYALGAMIFEASLLDYILEPDITANGTVYAIMIDAGSSGSRIYVYYWPVDLATYIPDVSLLNNVSQAASFSISPGISSFYGNFNGLNSSLWTLISFAKQWVPHKKWSSTNIYLYATAGMRLLPNYQQVQVISNVRTILGSGPFPVGDTRIISGIEEGLFGWLAINVLLRTLTDVQSTCVGILDLGGASTQNTFIPTYTPPQINHVPYKVTNKIYDTYTYSYLPYGNDQARISQRNLLVMNNAIIDPCSNPGIVYNWTSTITGITKTLSGSGNYTACRQTILPILNLKPNNLATSINGNSIPPVASITFYGISAFFTAKTTPSVLNLLTGSTNVTVAQLRSATQQYCATHNLTQIDPSKYAPTNCFLMAYAVSLLSDAYHFSDNAVIVFQDTINQITVTWAYGAILHEAMVLQEGALEILGPTPPTATPPTVTHTSFGTLLALFVLFVVFLC